MTFEMIGRGARLRPDLFGPGENKTHFLILDACMNFEFFNQNPAGAKTGQPEPLSQSIFKKRLALLQKTRRLTATNPELAPLAANLETKTNIPRDHEDYVVIQKIHWGIPLNAEDLAALETFFYQAEAVGGQAQFVQIYGPQENLAAFIRSLVGLDRAKAKERFAQFLDGKTYTADQIRFVNYIIDHLTANGTINPELLYGQPYTDIHYQGLTGVFSISQARELLSVVQAVNVVVS